MRHLPLMAAALAAATITGAARGSGDPEQAAVNGCIDALARDPGASAPGLVIDTMFSEAGTMVYLEAADGSIWQCLGYRDGSVASIGPAAPAEAEAALARAAEKAALAPERIRFAAGTSGATLTRTLDAGGATDYVLGARAGQRLDLSVAPQTGRMYYFIKGPDGALLIQGTDAATPFSGTLPLDGDYIVEVVSQESAPVTFDLVVEIR